MHAGGSKPGQRFGGRQKGTPNKPKQKLLARLEQDFPGYHPVAEMAAIANDPSVDIDIRARMHAAVAQYVEPKLRAIEHSTAPGEPLEVRQIMELDAALEILKEAGIDPNTV